MNDPLDAVDRWHWILTTLGVPARYLHNKHGPCPMCGGKDRFRWDDLEGRGTYICNQCGAGDGLMLVMGFKRWDKASACAAVGLITGTHKKNPLPPTRLPALRGARLLWVVALLIALEASLGSWLVCAYTQALGQMLAHVEMYLSRALDLSH